MTPAVPRARFLPGALRHSERGASLVELLVAMAISTFVIGALGTSLYQFYAISTYSQARMTALQDVQNAGLWLGRDAQEAAAFVPGAGSVYGTFRWSDASVEFRYSYDSGDGALVREHILGGVVQSTLPIARHVASQGDVVFAPTGNRVVVTLTSTSGPVTVTDSVMLTMRVP